jgi:hypothetical protein
MTRFWVGMLLVSLPLAAVAQRGPVLRESPPPDRSLEAPAPPNDAVTAAPLPPPDPNAPAAEAQPEMVPNPLEDPNVVRMPGSSGGASGQNQTPQGQPQRGGWVQMGTATLQALDKVNARAQTITVKVGDIGHFGSLDIAVRGCLVRTSDRPTDATALLVIRDQHADAPSFSGWMLRSEPSISMLAHPIYDIRVNGCSP